MGTRAGDVGVPKAEDCSAAVLSAERERELNTVQIRPLTRAGGLSIGSAWGAGAGAGATADMCEAEGEPPRHSRRPSVCWQALAMDPNAYMYERAQIFFLCYRDQSVPLFPPNQKLS